MWRSLLPEPVAAVLSELKESQAGVWLVGGAVRDHFLERRTVDFDFAVDGRARELARQVADRLGADYFDLDQQRDTGRVIADGDDRGWGSLDFAKLRADSIRGDLALRDFTVNALAVPVADQEQMLDPTGGLGDLSSGLLRLCSDDGLARDPVRAIRAVRLSAEFGLKLDPLLVRKIQEIAPEVSAASVERIRAEFFQILAQDRPAKALRVAQQLKLADVLLPKLNGDQFRRGFVRQDHLVRLTAAVVGQHDEKNTPDWVTGQCSVRLGRFRQSLAADLNRQLSSGRSRRQLLHWSMLYIPEGFQAAKIRTLLESWRLSRQEINQLSKLARAWRRWDGRPLNAAKGKRQRYLYFDLLGDMGVEMVFLALADHLTGQAGPPAQAIWEQEVEKGRQLLTAWYEGPKDDLDPEPILRGDELMDYLEIPAGPQLGELMAAIREEQAAGMITDRQQALNFAKKFYFEQN